ncbi:ABC transporter ATP-binding protein [Sediminibacillus albus]|uniref:Putative ABC transport system ATP-binding protein/lipoprotein-releasing system ATP-binding protein n=1 Tax=Sediminibacillus albus TaxID=407036 RepID=A0A1G8WP67_9BACI|nr:ABC transporter ATP-binding protein [Sediminibacillus albus]SDJ79440.1 putative ABC transport system ATP-binding protein/lipoprotein-releasing system ATP-binding protein [Sediminibacillus albus]
MKHSIQCLDVNKSFEGDGVTTTALKGINMSFQAGEFISIVGPSGSGKSTLLSLLGALDLPTDGTIRFGNKDLQKLKTKELADFRFQHIGFIFQQYHLLPTLTSIENVLAPLIARKVSYDKKNRAAGLLEEVGLADKLNALPSQLSGGQQQRVAVARALIHEPDWLLADEPTGNLDSETGEIIFNLLSRLNKEKSCGVVFVTHEEELATRAERMIEMKDGLVVQDTRSQALA